MFEVNGCRCQRDGKGSVGRINVLGLQTKLTILPVGGDKF